MKVYIVTSGEYSDYHIDAVFTDKEKAELYCALHNGGYDDYSPEEWDIDEENVETTKQYRKRWHVSILPNGEVSYIDYTCTFKDDNSITPCTNWKGLSHYAVIMTMDKDITEEKAKKIAFDRLAAWKYEQAMGRNDV